MITIDTCRADRLECYGYGLARTPAIDALAAEGVLCTNASTTAPITMPAHTSIMTGLFPPAHGVRDNGAYSLSDEAVTLAERLKDAGYSTHAIVSALVLNRRYNLTQGFDGYDDDLWDEDEPPMFMIRDRPAQRTGARAVSWLDEWKSAEDRSPFFMWVHFFDPHHPHDARVPDRYLLPLSYDREVAQADDGVEIIANWLREQEIIDDTLIVLTADHGESLGEHNEKTHAIFVYDATMRVPLIWRHPALLPAGGRYQGPVRAVDIMPTVLAALELPGGESTQGENLLSALQGQVEPPELPQYGESLLAEVGFGMAPLYSVRMDGYKYIRAPRPELYDLRADPKELRNIHDEKPELVSRLSAELDKILADSEARALGTTANPMDDETIEMLEALGYLADAHERKAVAGMDPKDGIQIYRLQEQGRHLAQRGQWAASEQALRELLEKVPGHVSARNTLALVLKKQDKLEEAEKEYAASLANDPRQNRVLFQMGRLMVSKGELEQGQRFFEQCLEITPRFVEAMIQLSFLEARAGNLEASLNWYEKAVTEDPTAPRAPLGFAKLYFEEGDYEKAHTYYVKAAESKPNLYVAIVQAGVCQLRLRDFDSARAHFSRAQEIRPEGWIPLYNIACANALQGHSDEALDYLAQTVENVDNFRLLLPSLAEDTDLDSLRGLARFTEIVARARERAAEAR